MKIAIIGTAGRKDDQEKLNKTVYRKMVKDCVTTINDYFDIWADKFGKDLNLISGGAAWADHIAVSIYLMDLADSLTLYLPCTLSEKHREFVGPAGKRPTGTSPSAMDRTADIANYYHMLFSQKMEKGTIEGLFKAKEKGAKLVVIDGGFKVRNLYTGQVDIVIAYTFGNNSSYPKDGGTSHCWNHSPATIKIHRRIHIDT